MNVSARWLRDLVPGLGLSPEEMSELLALRGAPVEAISSAGEGLGDVVVARVLATERHPNADRLTLCTVDAGAGELRVVCGASNVRPGGRYAFAPVGAELPGGVQIKRARIRGEISEGMLCSARELGLGTDHDGILELRGDFRPGEPLASALGLDDATLEVEVTANRGDLLSHVGLARELAHATQGRVVLPPLPGGEGPALRYREGRVEARGDAASVRIDEPGLCPRYLAAVVRGARVGPSPAWLERRLRGAGARPINNVVDATNYVMLELGQPLHAFDLARLAGSAIVVRRARPQERAFTTLDGQERGLSTNMLMICDAERPVAIAGVMGGLHSSVGSETTDLLIECALFDPKSIRATRKALDLSTDASYRFERGVDPEGMRTALERCVEVVLAAAGGRVDGPALDCTAKPFEPAVLALRLSAVERLLGVPFEKEYVRSLLEPLGFVVVRDEGGTLHVQVPGFRSHDVRREVDLVEEIARTHGYDRFPSTLGPYRASSVPDHPLFALEDELRRALAARGLFEAHTPAFAPEGEGDVELKNPLSTAERYLRNALAPGLLRRVEHNFAWGTRDVRLFEIGTTFRKAARGEPPHEETHVAAVLTGLRAPSHWSVPDEAFTVWDLKSLLEEVARRVWPEGVELAPGSGPGGPVGALLDPGAAFTVTLAGGSVVGGGGRVRDGVVDAPVWAEDVWALEVRLPSEPASRGATSYVRPPSHPPIDRDLALLVPETMPAGMVADELRRGAGDLLESVELFDVYTGAGIPAGTRSLGFRLRFRAVERTLKDEEVDRAVRSALGRLEEELGVRARS